MFLHWNMFGIIVCWIIHSYLLLQTSLRVKITPVVFAAHGLILQQNWIWSQSDRMWRGAPASSHSPPSLWTTGPLCWSVSLKPKQTNTFRSTYTHSTEFIKDTEKIQTRWIISLPVFQDLCSSSVVSVWGVLDTKQTLLRNLRPDEVNTNQSSAGGPDQGHRPGHRHHLCHWHCRALGHFQEVHRWDKSHLHMEDQWWQNW